MDNDTINITFRLIRYNSNKLPEIIKEIKVDFLGISRS